MTRLENSLEKYKTPSENTLRSYSDISVYKSHCLRA